MARSEVPSGDGGDLPERGLRAGDPHTPELLASVLDATTDLVGIVDHEIRTVYLNRAARRFLGLGDDDGIDGLTPVDFVPPDRRDEYVALVLDAIAESDHWSGEVVLRRHDGVDVPCSQVVLVHRDDDGRMLHLSSVARDISETKRLEARLEHEATHDALTGLSNRRLLIDRIEQAVSRSRRHGDDVVVLFVDLDRFTSVNDRFGHAAGDEVLVEVAQRLRRAMRLEDVVGRFGGDEFVVLCEDLPAGTAPDVIGQRVIDALAAPYEVEAGEAVIEVSVGVVVTGAGPVTPDRLLRTADEAMYRAKGRGHNQLEVIRLPPGY
ncbi:MAG TPA: diguanylate cyclase [Acidimicrobiales bacterium]|nr:diguanylate cyclase [Acidimicrobiales bacterium]